jgi:hypothetical protein
VATTKDGCSLKMNLVESAGDEEGVHKTQTKQWAMKKNAKGHFYWYGTTSAGDRTAYLCGGPPKTCRSCSDRPAPAVQVLAARCRNLAGARPASPPPRPAAPAPATVCPVPPGCGLKAPAGPPRYGAAGGYWVHYR